MPDYETLKVVQDGNVVTAFLHRPEARNAINMRMVVDLGHLIDAVEDAADATVLVLRGGPDVFTAGIDLEELASRKPREIVGLQKWERACRQLERVNKLTVAAVQGECIGAGCQLVLSCDARIAESGAVFCFNEVKRGFLPGMAVFRLAKYVGYGRAKNLMLGARRLCAEEAVRWGILDQVCDPPALDGAIRRVISDLMPFDPITLELTRRLLDDCYANNYEEYLGRFLAAQHRAINSEAFNRGLIPSTEVVASEPGVDGPQAREGTA